MFFFISSNAFVLKPTLPITRIAILFFFYVFLLWYNTWNSGLVICSSSFGISELLPIISRNIIKYENDNKGGEDLCSDTVMRPYVVSVLTVTVR